ncbi:hypothetical protein RHSIM_Rhsim04G0143600 [Rhododendron simsii]|uniref:Uncharacterized protein n=1 Tax=Rhododendron simsii TaxID=118357 RepID=A0A834LRX4_RHOSS|nr:hypothetical protein RHSIM_Rhsim04G0143600 [Rhododendron simsii]
MTATTQPIFLGVDSNVFHPPRKKNSYDELKTIDSEFINIDQVVLFDLILAKWLVESALVPPRLFQEHCEEEFLWESEMIKITVADLKSKEVFLYPFIFGLLQVKAKGWARAYGQPEEWVVLALRWLPGAHERCFQGDKCYARLPCFVKVVLQSHASQILGFKFQYYQHMEVNRHASLGLYQLTALLVKEDFIDLDSMLVVLCIIWLLMGCFQFIFLLIVSIFNLDSRFKANKIGKINLAAIGKDLMEDEKQGDVTIDLFTAIDLESEAVTVRASRLENNQTLGLHTGFLSVNDW